MQAILQLSKNRYDWIVVMHRACSPNTITSCKDVARCIHNFVNGSLTHGVQCFCFTSCPYRQPKRHQTSDIRCLILLFWSVIVCFFALQRSDLARQEMTDPSTKQDQTPCSTQRTTIQISDDRTFHCFVIVIVVVALVHHLQQ
jgi:hypothetical protein